MENKQVILNLLLKALKQTRDAFDVEDLIYDGEKETVTVLFISGGTRTVNVAMDSGVAMIRDVMKHLGV